MKKILLLLIFSLFLADTFAQVSSDSLAYQAQRKKINSMLAQRKQKFGQYTESLTKHTGIFGLQTKKDVRRSNSILMDIVKTDDDIYAQLKILLNYRAFQQTVVQSKLDSSKETEKYNIGLMNAINRFRAENDKLKAQLNDSAKSQEKTTRSFIIVIVLMLVSILLLLRSKYAAKA